MNILEAQSINSIINRATRALANLAEDPTICAAIHAHEAMPSLLIKLLLDGGDDKWDSNCKQSIVRALRILANNDRHKWEVIKNKGKG